MTFTLTNSFARNIGAISKDSEDQISAWIHIGEDNIVTIFTGKAEVGQNIRTSLAQIVAEEMEVPVDNITMVMGDTALTPYDRGTWKPSIPIWGLIAKGGCIGTRYL